MNMRGIGEFLANKAEFEAQGIPVEVAPMTHLTRNLAYWLDPEKGDLGALSANYIYDVAEARKLTTSAGFSSPIDIEYHVLPSGDGVVPEQEQLVIDSLQQSGLFNVTSHDRPRPERDRAPQLQLTRPVRRPGPERHQRGRRPHHLSRLPQRR
jgi:hypothetical protein